MPLVLVCGHKPHRINRSSRTAAELGELEDVSRVLFMPLTSRSWLLLCGSPGELLAPLISYANRNLPSVGRSRTAASGTIVYRGVARENGVEREREDRHRSGSLGGSRALSAKGYGRAAAHARGTRTFSSPATDGTAHGMGSSHGRRERFRVVPARKGSVSATSKRKGFRKKTRQDESSPAAHGRCRTVVNWHGIG